MADAFLMGQSGNGGSLKIVEGTVESLHSYNEIDTIYDYYYEEYVNVYNTTDVFTITHVKNINNLYLQFNIHDYQTIENSIIFDNSGVCEHGILIDSNFANKQLYTSGLWLGRSVHNNNFDKYNAISAFMVLGSGTGLGYLTPLIKMTVSGIGTNTVTITFSLNNVNYSSAGLNNISYKIIG